MIINNRWVSWERWLLLSQTNAYKNRTAAATLGKRDTLILNPVRPTAWDSPSKDFPGVQLLWVGYL